MDDHVGDAEEFVCLLLPLANSTLDAILDFSARTNNSITTLPPIYLSLSNSRWKRSENARKTH